MRTIKVANGQSLLDIALQEMGSIDSVVAIAELNGIDITDDLPIGMEIEVPNTPDNSHVTNLYASDKHKPATA